MTTLEKIRRLREQNGFSQEYLAHRLCMSQNNYSKIELGKVKISLEQLEKIVNIYGMSVKDVLDFGEPDGDENLEAALLQKRIDTLESDVGLLKNVVTRILNAGGK